LHLYPFSENVNRQGKGSETAERRSRAGDIDHLRARNQVVQASPLLAEDPQGVEQPEKRAELIDGDGNPDSIAIGFPDFPLLDMLPAARGPRKPLPAFPESPLTASLG
jgi:hypothetical protein